MVPDGLTAHREIQISHLLADGLERADRPNDGTHGHFGRKDHYQSCVYPAAFYYLEDWQVDDFPAHYLRNIGVRIPIDCARACCVSLCICCAAGNLSQSIPPAMRQKL
jgi:hypothetical protein